MNKKRLLNRVTHINSIFYTSEPTYIIPLVSVKIAKKSERLTTHQRAALIPVPPVSPLYNMAR